MYPEEISHPPDGRHNRLISRKRDSVKAEILASRPLKINWRREKQTK
jgi:hypothetical protein